MAGLPDHAHHACTVAQCKLILLGLSLTDAQDVARVGSTCTDQAMGAGCFVGEPIFVPKALLSLEKAFSRAASDPSTSVDAVSGSIGTQEDDG